MISFPASNAGLVDAAGVDPKVSQAISSGLFAAKADLFVPNLVLADSLFEVFVGDLFRAPGVGQYRVRGNVGTWSVVCKAE